MREGAPRDPEPCPCCEGNSVPEVCHRFDVESWSVACEVCGLTTRPFPTREEAVEMWNRRPYPDGAPSPNQLRRMLSEARIQAAATAKRELARAGETIFREAYTQPMAARFIRLMLKGCARGKSTQSAIAALHRALRVSRSTPQPGETHLEEIDDV